MDNLINLNNLDPDIEFYNNNAQDQHNVNSEYFDMDKYNRLLQNHPASFVIMNFNIRSFEKNIDLFNSFLGTAKKYPDIFIFSETWFKPNTYLPTLSGYESHHSIRSINNGGGISIYYNEKYDMSPLYELSHNNSNIESCCLEITTANKESLVILSIYRPPSGQIEQFINTLLDILNHIKIKNKKMVICGDININLFNQNSLTTLNYIQTLHSHHFTQTITQATRIPPNNTDNLSLIDHTWINSDIHIKSGVFEIDITDHFPTFTLLNMQTVKQNETYKKIHRVHNETNIINFMQKLSNYVWNFDNINSLDENFQKFNNSLNKLYCSCFPKATKQYTDKLLSKPWLTPGIKTSLKTKSLKLKLMKQGRITIEENKRYRNLLANVIKRAKNYYNKNLFVQNQNNPKKTWSIIKNLMGKKNSKRIKSIVVNNQTITNDKDIANAMNDFFATVATELDSKLPIPNQNTPPVNANELNNNINESLFLTPVTIDECISIINKLKNTKNDIDCIPIFLLKKVKHLIAEPLCRLINSSLEYGIFPQSLKEACITPIFKEGDPTIITNYRPISVLPYISKILERCIATRITCFLERHNVISPSQYGFQRNKSTTDALADLFENIYDNLDNKQHTLAIYLDFRKAFDTVNHPILLNKLNSVGIRGVAHNWFTSYLKDRKHRVKINGTKSNLKTCNIGVPQGSILGPILFLIFINDLPQLNNVMKSILYADDTTLLFTGNNITELTISANTKLKDVYNWLTLNRLSVNLDKTYACVYTNLLKITESEEEIIYTDRTNTKMKLDPVILNENHIKFKINDPIKYLGIQLDISTSFSKHIAYISTKISKIIGIFYKLRNILPMKSLVDLYHSLIYPYLIYCNILWGKASDSYINQLFLLQKRLVRIITNSEFLAHTDPLFRSTEILKLKDIYTYLIAIEGYKKNITNNFTYTEHTHNTRSRNSFAVPNYRRLQISKRSLTYSIPLIWNKIPNEIKNVRSLTMFKKNLKLHLIEKYDAIN